MKLVEVYFGFHDRDTLRAAWRKRSWTFFGHVEAWGYTRDGTWAFLDPAAAGSTLLVTHHADEVDDLLAARFEVCVSILRVAPPERKLRHPLHPTMNCASQCAHLVGLRAYSPWGLRRMLLANGAVEVQDARSEGERECAGGAPA